MNTCYVSCRYVNSLVYLQLFDVNVTDFFYSVKNLISCNGKILIFGLYSTKQIFERLLIVYKDSLPPIPWVAEVKNSRTSLEDDPTEGRSKTASISKIVAKKLHMVLIVY